MDRYAKIGGLYFMTLNQAFFDELTSEAAITRRCLERVPAELFAWKPHDRSYSFGQLAAHITEMFGWVPGILETPELDLAAFPYTAFTPTTAEELLEAFDANVNGALASIKDARPETFYDDWTMREGEKIYFTMPKAACLRSFILNHTIHHRGQLSGYLRSNDIPVPSIYGPSADEGVS